MYVLLFKTLSNCFPKCLHYFTLSEATEKGLLSYWKAVFAGYRNLGGQFVRFSFFTVNMLFHCITTALSVCVLSQRGHVQLFVAPGTVTRQVSLPMKFSRQEYCSRGPFPTPGALPDPGIETARLASPVLAGNSLPLVPPGKPNFGHYCFTKEISLNSYSCNISFSSSCF